MKAPYSVADARRLAARRLPRILYDFIDGGSGDEVTLRANRQAFRDLTLRPRGAVDPGTPSLATTVLGQEVDFPVLISPCGGVSLVHPDGQVGVARAASDLRTICAASVLCGSDLALVAATEPGRHWLQLFPLGGREASERLVDFGRQAGFGALVLTIDSIISGRKERDIRNGGVRPGGVSLSKVDLRTLLWFGPKVVGRPAWVWRFLRAGLPVGHPVLSRLGAGGTAMSYDDAVGRWLAEPLTWADIQRIRDDWRGPIVVKGVLTAEDARRARDCGADAVVVSNHGGRQLDGAAATIAVLPEVVSAVGAEVEVLLDGGVRRGTDVVRALALGARAVMVGRPYLWGLALDGRAGVAHVLGLLRDEMVAALRLLGVSGVKDLDRSVLDLPKE